MASSKDFPDLDGGVVIKGSVPRKGAPQEPWALQEGGTLHLDVRSTSPGRWSAYSYRYPGGGRSYPLDADRFSGVVSVRGGMDRYTLQQGHLVASKSATKALQDAVSALSELYAAVLASLDMSSPCDAGTAQLLDTVGLGPVPHGAKGSEVHRTASVRANKILDRAHEVLAHEGPPQQALFGLLQLLSRCAGLPSPASIDSVREGDTALSSDILKMVSSLSSASGPAKRINSLAVAGAAPDPMSAAESMLSGGVDAEVVKWVGGHKDSPVVLELISLLHDSDDASKVLEALGGSFVVEHPDGGYLRCLSPRHARAWVASNESLLRKDPSCLLRMQKSSLQAVATALQWVAPSIASYAKDSGSAEAKHISEDLWRSGHLTDAESSRRFK